MAKNWQNCANDIGNETCYSDVPEWAWKYAAYAYNNGITTGVNAEGTLYGSNRPVTCQEFTAFLLRALGYNEKDGDFIYAGTLVKAIEVGLYDKNRLETLSGGYFLRGYAVASMVDALLTNLKSANERKLIDSLTEKKLFSKLEAQAFTKAVSSYKDK